MTDVLSLAVKRPNRAAGVRGVACASQLDRAGSIPLFLQVTRRLRESLELNSKSGLLRPGDFFTTEKAVCKQFGVSIITAKRALDDLEAAGILVRLQGRGTFVARSRVNQVLDHFYRFTTAMEEQGFHPAWKNIAIGRGAAEARIAKALNLDAGAPVIQIERLRMLNDEPFFLHTSYLPERLFPGLEREDHAAVSLYNILAQKYNVEPVRCRDTFEPALLHRRAARFLQVPTRSAGILLERIAYNTEGTPIEVSRGVVRGDRWRLSVELK